MSRQNIEIPDRRPHLVLAPLQKFWGSIPWMLEATIVIQLLLDKGGEAAIIGTQPKAIPTGVVSDGNPLGGASSNAKRSSGGAA